MADPSFEMDLRFPNTVYDRVTDAFVPNGPELRTTGCVEWSWSGSGLDSATEREVEAALQTWRDYEQGEATFEEAEILLERLRPKVPDFEFLFSLMNSWQRVLYCLKHEGRATFALPYTEYLATRGAGSNGKDTLANRMADFLGGYSVTLACEALTQGRSLDAPSQTILGLRAKRWVSVRELSGSDRIRGHVIKSISDAKARIKARGATACSVPTSC